ncbi:MAG: N-acetylneuraminate synthase [Proteobacteria bacterium]|nr:N-acetylneuraminate synthase [Pseudomonadota bacterium]
MISDQKNKRSVFIIAEAGVNHNGSIEMAKQLIEVAAGAGADAVKFQTFTAENVISRGAPKADYQKVTTDTTESQLEMLQRLELDQAAHEELLVYGCAKNLEFMSTPFDGKSVDLLVKLGVARLKVSSGEITNAPLLLKMARTGLPLIMSTGMSTLGEVEASLGVLAFGYLGWQEKPSKDGFQRALGEPEGLRILRERITLLHCTTEYPAPFMDVNLRAMDTLAGAFGLPVGYSDHTPGIAIPIAAAARGAVVIEKHFTLDKRLPGPDHQASLEPGELTAMVQGIRQVEAALGSPRKLPAASELKNREMARRSLVATRRIRKGEYFSEDNLTSKRPGNGISPLYYWDWIGKVAERDYQPDEIIQ